MAMVNGTVMDSSRQAAIELKFLTGSRQGTSHFATESGVSVGDLDSCDVVLESDVGTPKEQRNINIRFTQSAWEVRNLGTSVVAVNHNVVAECARLRSGDVIRLSLYGPEVMFSIVVGKRAASNAENKRHSRQATPREVRSGHDSGGIAAAPMSRLGMYSSAAGVLVLLLAIVVLWMVRGGQKSDLHVRTIPSQHVDEDSPWQLAVAGFVANSASESYEYRAIGDLPEGMVLEGGSGRLSWTPRESQGPGAYSVRLAVVRDDGSTTNIEPFTIEVREVNSFPTLAPIADVSFTLGTNDVVEVQVQAEDCDLPVQNLRYRLGSDSPKGMVIDPDSGLIRWSPAESHVGQTFKVEVVVSDPNSAQNPQRGEFEVTVFKPDEDPQVARSEVSDAVYLLAVEEKTSGTVFPYAIAFSVRQDLLLSTATVVQELARFVEKGQSVFAIHCVSQEQIEITTLFVHPEFSRLQDRREEQIYFDIGAIGIAGEARSFVSLLSGKDAAVIEQGAPLRCVMPIVEAEPLTKFSSIVPSYTGVKVYMVTRGGQSDATDTDHPRLISLVGTLPRNSYGSPLVDEQGTVIAMYVEKADLSGNKGLDSLVDRFHYAACLDFVSEVCQKGAVGWQGVGTDVRKTQIPPE